MGVSSETPSDGLFADEPRVVRSAVETIEAIRPTIEGNRDMLAWLRGERQWYDDAEEREHVGLRLRAVPVGELGVDVRARDDPHGAVAGVGVVDWQPHGDGLARRQRPVGRVRVPASPAWCRPVP